MIGKTLSHYKIVSQLGRGGMGEVYVAEDPRLKRKVALKILPPEMAADPARRSRFEREAQAVAALNHPNIVTIHSVEEDDGVHFITMELIDGEPLSQGILPGGLPLGVLFDIAIPLADALGSAHEHGVTHRDLKPDNVMITKEGRVKVLDFGLAKLAGGFRAGDSEEAERPTATVTAEGKILGTVAYMSPEQAEAKPVDARSDVFSLGILLYEMATGRRPFQGDTSVSTISSILKDSPPSVTELNASLPRHLGRIVHRCLIKDPERRYQTAKELRNELEQLRHEMDTGELGTIPSGITARPPRKRSIPLLAGSLALAVLLFAAIWMLWPRPSDRGAAPGPEPKSGKPSVAVLPFTTVGAPEEDRAFVDGIHSDLLTQISKVSALKVISRTSVMEYAGEARNLREIANELDVATVLEGSVQRAGERVRINVQLIDARNDENIWAETYDRELTARNVFEIQGEIANQIATALQATLTPQERADLDAVPTASLEAYQFYLKGNEYFSRITDGKTAIAITVEMFERAVEQDPEFALAYARLATAHAFSYWLHDDRTRARLALAKEAIDRAFEIDPDLPEAHVALGYYYYWGYLDYDRALEQFAVAARVQPNNANLLQGIAAVQRRQGKTAEALATFRRAEELDPRAYNSVLAVADTLSLLRQYEAAVEHFDRLIALNPDDEQVYVRRAWVQVRWRGDARGALEVMDRARARAVETPYLRENRLLLEIVGRNYEAALEQLDSVSSETVVDDQFNFRPKDLVAAQVHRLLGDGQQARALFEAARRELERRIRATPDDERLYGALGIAYAGLGRKEDAVREGLRAVELLPVDKEAWRGAYRVEDLAVIYTMVGERDLAIDQLELLLSRPCDLSASQLEIDPSWDPLRENPRFRRLVEGDPAR